MSGALRNSNASSTRRTNPSRLRPTCALSSKATSTSGRSESKPWVVDRDKCAGQTNTGSRDSPQSRSSGQARQRMPNRTSRLTFPLGGNVRRHATSGRSPCEHRRAKVHPAATNQQLCVRSLTPPNQIRRNLRSMRRAQLRAANAFTRPVRRFRDG